MSTFLRANPSYWESLHFYQPRDIIVVGAGLIGLATALAIKRKKPHWSIGVIDRHPIGLGASTRNAGFACFGSPSEILADARINGMDEAIDLVKWRWNGLVRLRELVGDKFLKYEPTGGYEVFMPADMERVSRCLELLSELNDQLLFTGSTAYSVASQDQIENSGMKGLTHMIHCHHEGMIDPGSMVSRLHQLCHKEDIKLIFGMGIREIGSNQSHAWLETSYGQMLKAGCVVVATNGFTRHLLPELEVYPARNQVLLTSEIPHLKLKGTFHYDEGYIYFRNVNNRLLLGGARNIDMEREQTDQFGLTLKIRTHLEQFLASILLPDQHCEINWAWSGILGIGPSKRPLIQWHDDRILLACRMGGMGISIGAAVAKEAADLTVAT